MRTATIRNNERLVALTKSQENAIIAMQKIYARRRKTIAVVLNIVKYLSVAAMIISFMMSVITKDYLYEGSLVWYHFIIALLPLGIIAFFSYGFSYQIKKISKR